MRASLRMLALTISSGGDMDLRKAMKLQEEFAGKQCDHPKLSKERLGGMSFDYACVRCGRSFDDKEVDELQRQRKQAGLKPATYS
jgi:hypothetical protein